jgi:hypothetical protein
MKIKNNLFFKTIHLEEGYVHEATLDLLKYPVKGFYNVKFVLGNKNVAENIVEELEKAGWVKKISKDGRVIYYSSPNGIDRVNFHTISSSAQRLLEKGYLHQATLDLLRYSKKGFEGKILHHIEIKFVLPK